MSGGGGKNNCQIASLYKGRFVSRLELSADQIRPWCKKCIHAIFMDKKLPVNPRSTFKYFSWKPRQRCLLWIYWPKWPNRLQKCACFFCLCSADQALDRFAMKRFYEDKVLPVGQPSQRRSVVLCFPHLTSYLCALWVWPSLWAISFSHCSDLWASPSW